MRFDLSSRFGKIERPTALYWFSRAGTARAFRRARVQPWLSDRRIARDLGVQAATAHRMQSSSASPTATAALGQRDRKRGSPRDPTTGTRHPHATTSLARTDSARPVAANSMAGRPSPPTPREIEREVAGTTEHQPGAHAHRAAAAEATARNEPCREPLARLYRQTVAAAAQGKPNADALRTHPFAEDNDQGPPERDESASSCV